MQAQIGMKLYFFCFLIAISAYGQEMDSLRTHVMDSLIPTQAVDGTKQIGILSGVNGDAELKSDSMNLPVTLDDYSVKLNAERLKLMSKIDSLSQSTVRDSLSFLALKSLRCEIRQPQPLSFPSAGKS